ncbi:MAG: hypothetical protein ABL927_06815 [Bdellovibrionales bacterium]
MINSQDNSQDNNLESVNPAINNVVSPSADALMDSPADFSTAGGIPAEIMISSTSTEALVYIENDDDFHFIDSIDNILDLEEKQYPIFTLAKNKARFLRMLTWYKQKELWLDVAPISGVSRLFKQQTKELEGIRSNKLDYEMELETGTLTPSQRSYRRDELKMCKVHEKMAVYLIAKMQVKIKSGRR